MTRTMLPAETPADHTPWVWATVPQPEVVTRTLPADWRPAKSHRNHTKHGMQWLITNCLPCARLLMEAVDELADRGDTLMRATSDRWHHTYDETLKEEPR